MLGSRMVWKVSRCSKPTCVGRSLCAVARACTALSPGRRYLQATSMVQRRRVRVTSVLLRAYSAIILNNS